VLARNKKGKIMGRKARLEAFCPPTWIKWKRCQKKKRMGIIINGKQLNDGSFSTTYNINGMMIMYDDL
jgi:hypothetical protein